MKELTPELERKNLILGWALFGVFLLLFAGTVGVALLYLTDLPRSSESAERFRARNPRAARPLPDHLLRPSRRAGIRLAVKDLFDTAGLETTYGSAIFAGHVPERTASAVLRLEDAGYVNVGKANLHEFAYGTTSENPHFGDVPNPRFPGRVAGGSSGGSAAAVAAGLADAALGTDSAGSIRIPAACCGVVGHKPTHGLVPLDGCWPLAASFDTGGPLAADVEACERMLAALAPGFEPVELESLEELEVGVAWTELADPLVRERVEAAAARFPRRRPVELPFSRRRDPRRLQPRGGRRPPRALRGERRPLRRGRPDQDRAVPRRSRLRVRARRAAPRRVPGAGRAGARGARPRPHADAPDRRRRRSIAAPGRATWTCACR